MMHIENIQAWQVKSQQFSQEAKFLSSQITLANNGKENQFGRTYAFDLPIIGIVNRLSRGQKLFELAISENRKVESLSFSQKFNLQILFVPLALLFALYLIVPKERKQAFKSTVENIFEEKFRFKQRWVSYKSSFKEQLQIPAMIFIPSDYVRPKQKVAVETPKEQVNIKPQLNLGKEIIATLMNNEVLNQLVALQKSNEQSIYESGSISTGTVKVVTLVGQAYMSENRALKVGDSVLYGETIFTGKKSFLKLQFNDYSELGISSESAFQIQPPVKNSPMVIQLWVGFVRARIVHWFLKEREKFIIKTKNAAMGVRGTDFFVSFMQSNENTMILTVEGKVAVAKLQATNENPEIALKDPNRIQGVGDGQYNNVIPLQPQPTRAIKMDATLVKNYEDSIKLESPNDIEHDAAFFSLQDSDWIQSDRAAINKKNSDYRLINAIPKIYQENEKEFSDLIKQK